MSQDDKDRPLVTSQVKLDPTLPICFRPASERVRAFSVEAVEFMAHAHKTHDELGSAIDMYVSCFVSMFYALPLTDEYLAMIKKVIDRRWAEQASIQKLGIESATMRGDAEKSRH